MVEVPGAVPLFELHGTRREFTFGPRPPAGHNTTLAELASTETGFLPDRVPDFRFPGPLQAVPDLCRAAAPVHQQRDATAFRAWLRGRAASLPEAPVLLRHAGELPSGRAELLLVPLVHLNHLWRQGDPDAEPATGPSELLPALLAEALANPSVIYLPELVGAWTRVP